MYPASPSTCFQSNALCSKEVCRSVKQGALLTSIALASITLFAALIGTCALNGLPLGGINALAAHIGSTTIHLGVVGGATWLLIDFVILAVMTRPDYSEDLPPLRKPPREGTVNGNQNH